MKLSAILIVVLLEPMLAQGMARRDNSAEKTDLAELEDDYNVNANLGDSPSYLDENLKSPDVNSLTLEKKNEERR
ncbi:hypothetical protein N7478_011388 [Penicillium angulare]|uniref:uncharacterized protein n=1 Tax=Penicillium angulare TaxID=116970 RepID=UPI002540073D|nr:uncharacterized protein N7478_011388 [Penicillium angulare]KAJ5263783.1 hypothetical protein N7478_011388 [Penicillium angulare]